MANSKDLTKKFLDDAFVIREFDINFPTTNLSSDEKKKLDIFVKGEVTELSDKYANLESPEKEYLEGLKKFYGLVMEDKQVNYKEIEKGKLSLDTKIKSMDFSVRAWNCLTMNDIEYLGQLVELPKNDLLKMRNLGKHTATLIDEEVEKAGYEMGMRIGYVKPEDRK